VTNPLTQLAAHDAAGACRTAAAVVRADAEERSSVAARARADWEGPHRRRFDRALAVQERRAAALEASALRLAAVLDALATE
jgi:hypothetical protein